MTVDDASADEGLLATGAPADEGLLATGAPGDEGLLATGASSASAPKEPAPPAGAPPAPAAKGTAPPAGAPPAGSAFDEDTLGRSTSVFDAGVEMMPPAVPPVMMTPPMMPEPAPERPLSARERRRRVRLEARRVRRIIRHIEPWSVLKISVLFYFCLWLIFVLAGVLLWSFAESSGTLESIEDLIEDLFALDPAEDFWSGGTIFRAYAIGTLILSIGGVAFNVLLCVLYNLISDLTGGIRLTVIEEESARFVPPKRRPRR